jgi:hypothetical protein
MRRRLATASLATLRTLFGARAVPLALVRLLWLAVGRRGDRLATPVEKTQGTGRDLANGFLAGALADEVLGTWALDAATINYLEGRIRELRPCAILEFGSGISTAFLARMMAEVHGDATTPRVLSIEQNPDCMRETVGRLQALRLDRQAFVAHAPLVTQQVGDVEAECYQLDSQLRSRLASLGPELVLVDGPAGGPWVRLGTLPLVRQFLATRCTFYLDDALRDAELGIATRWSRLPFVEISGVRLFGKGLLCGVLEP